jgi:hypothetical protein
MSLILSGSEGLSDIDGSAATPAIRGTDSNTGMFFPAADTIAFAEGGAESMRIDSSGRVGIGTSSPDTILNIQGVDPTFLIQDSDEAGDGFIKFQTANGTQRAFIQAAMTANVMLLGVGTSEAMRIDSSGNLLVGTASGGGAGGVTFYPLGNGAGSATVQVFNKTNTTTDPAIQFRVNGSTVAAISYTSTTVTYATSSDYRLKQDIAPMTGALDKIAALKPVTYKWKADGSAGEGFIAHELAEVVPDAVVGAKDAVDADGNPQYQGIDTSFLVATLTAAIQEQQALITSLTARIAALEGAAQ